MKRPIPKNTGKGFLASRLPPLCLAHSGFSLLELVWVVGIIGILMAIAIPNYLRWKPNMELKSAARSLYGKMHETKIQAIKQQKPWAVIFNPAGNSFDICDDSGVDGDWATAADNNCVEQISLTSYGQGVRFGHGAATGAVGASFGGDNVSYTSNHVEFTPRGLGNGGYVYLEHNKSSSSYAVGTTTVGGIKILRWKGGANWK